MLSPSIFTHHFLGVCSFLGVQESQVLTTSEPLEGSTGRRWITGFQALSCWIPTDPEILESRPNLSSPPASPPHPLASLPVWVKSTGMASTSQWGSLCLGWDRMQWDWERRKRKLLTLYFSFCVPNSFSPPWKGNIPG